MPTRTVGNFRIARVAVSGQGTEEGRSVAANADVVLHYSASGRKEELNPIVMNTVEKVTAYTLQTRALEDAAAGNVVANLPRLGAMVS